VEEKQHSFSFTSSFDQRFSLVVVACLCLTSFLAWPLFDNLFYHLIKAALFAFMLLFFTYQLRLLNHWKCHFMLNGIGEGSLVGGDKFTLCNRAFVSPFVCVFYIQTVKGQKLFMVWSDMCDDTSYRHLCRLLLANKA
jgi:toxin CptA